MRINVEKASCSIQIDFISSKRLLNLSINAFFSYLNVVFKEISAVKNCKVAEEHLVYVLKR